MRVSSAYEHLSQVSKTHVMSWVTHKCKEQKIVNPKIPGHYFRHNLLHGAKPNFRCKEEEEFVEENKDNFTVGQLYSNRKKKYSYSPKSIPNDCGTFFHMYNLAKTNDCLVHAINFALRCEFFTCREQVITLM